MMIRCNRFSQAISRQYKTRRITSVAQRQCLKCTSEMHYIFWLLFCLYSLLVQIFFCNVLCWLPWIIGISLVDQAHLVQKNQSSGRTWLEPCRVREDNRSVSWKWKQVTVCLLKITSLRRASFQVDFPPARASPNALNIPWIWRAAGDAHGCRSLLRGGEGEGGVWAGLGPTQEENPFVSFCST